MDYSKYDEWWNLHGEWLLSLYNEYPQEKDDWGRSRVHVEHIIQAAQILGVDPTARLEYLVRLHMRTSYTGGS